MPKTALVTGAAGDIGLAIAVRLAEISYALVLVGRHQRALDDAAEQIAARAPDVDICCEACDVADPEAVSALFDRLVEACRTINVLVNGAGISGGGVTASLELELWKKVIDTNLNGTFFVTREALARKLVPSGGRIINIAAICNEQDVLHGTAFFASKYGVVGLTKALGWELARTRSGITVNAVCPAFVESDMAREVRERYAKLLNTFPDQVKQSIEARIPIRRYVEPFEVAEMVAYLVSPHAAAVTAQSLNVGGGVGS